MEILQFLGSLCLVAVQCADKIIIFIAITYLFLLAIKRG